MSVGRLMGVRVLAVFALLLAACGGGLTASPTPAPSPLSVAELKYRVMDAGGRIEFCDPDFYPIARSNEDDLAKAKIAEIQKDAETYAAITKRVGTDALAVYRDWKALNALVFSPASFGGPSQPQTASFNYRSTGGPNATATKASGTQLEGTVDVFGRVDITKRTTVGPLNCPICLARDTEIATPSGEVAVQDLKVGDIVWTLANGVRVAAPLVAIGSTPVPTTHEVVRVVLSDGRTVLVSPGHPTADGRHVGDLRAGDELDGATVVSAVREPYDGGFTFDVRSAGPSGAYWADGVLLGSTIP
ncbi:MAG TPA: Hint domain-containing protein [Candidatus Acidoferrales bacterium]|nr:Hint domain-containing protein [Candidatus Acidoferrales bacterium]